MHSTVDYSRRCSDNSIAAGSNNSPPGGSNRRSSLLKSSSSSSSFLENLLLSSQTPADTATAARNKRPARMFSLSPNDYYDQQPPVLQSQVMTLMTTCANAPILISTKSDTTAAALAHHHQQLQQQQLMQKNAGNTSPESGLQLTGQSMPGLAGGYGAPGSGPSTSCLGMGPSDQGLNGGYNGFNSRLPSDATGSTQKQQQQQEIICEGCRKRIVDRFLLQALDKYWHEDCLKCSCCHARLGELGSSLYIKSNVLFCKTDYFRIFGNSGHCCACNKTIPPFELVMRARNNVYHLDCFACQACNKRFCVGDRFYLCDNKIMCEVDFREHSIFASMPYTSLAQIKRQIQQVDDFEEFAAMPQR